MTADERAFLNAIIAAPDDDLPRPVFADWLEEHDQPARAEFIRLQCQLARGDADGLPSSHLAEMREKERVFYRDHIPEWRLQLPVVRPVVLLGDFRRGFIESARVFSAMGDTLPPILTFVLRLFPLRVIDVEVYTIPPSLSFLHTADLGSIRGFRFIPSSDWIGREYAVPLAEFVMAHRWHHQLEWLELRQWDYRRSGADVWLTESYSGPKLRFVGCRFRDEDRRQIQSHFLDRVTL